MNYEELVKPLYHGSFTSFSKIDLTKSVPKKDFGRGFYTTNDIEQAKKFARLKAARKNLHQGYILKFDFINNEQLKIKKFQASDAEWFDFVLINRGFGNYTIYKKDENADIIIGPVANDAVGVVLNNFVDGVYGDQYSPESKDTAVRLLLTQKLHNQIFFGTDIAVSCLIFKELIDVYLDR